MKGLVFILAIGPLLLSFADSVRPNGINMDEEFTHLCGRQYLRKVSEICRGWPWKGLLPCLYDPIQASDNNDYFKETDMKKVQKMYDNAEIQQLDSYYGQQPFYNDYNQYEQMTDDFNEYVFQTERDSIMQRARSNSFTRMKLSTIVLHKKCCKSTCTARLFLQLCKI